jgi:F0F1-type ATP synthase membrane subunit b/b'
MMSIPARPDYDPDFVIGDGLDVADELRAEADALRAENEQLRERLAPVLAMFVVDPIANAVGLAAGVKALFDDRDNASTLYKAAMRRAEEAERERDDFRAQLVKAEAELARVRPVVEAAKAEHLATAQYYRGDANNDPPEVMQKYAEEGWTRFDALVQPKRNKLMDAVQAFIDHSLPATSGPADGGKA